MVVVANYVADHLALVGLVQRGDRGGRCGRLAPLRGRHSCGQDAVGGAHLVVGVMVRLLLLLGLFEGRGRGHRVVVAGAVVRVV